MLACRCTPSARSARCSPAVASRPTIRRTTTRRRSRRSTPCSGSSTAGWSSPTWSTPTRSTATATTRRGSTTRSPPLAPRVEGRVVGRLEVLDPRWCDPAPPSALDDAARGRRVERVWRRGKYLVWELEDDVHLVMHLRMTGNMLLADDAPYTRVRIELSGGARVLFTDPRRFGTGVVLLGSDARDDYFAARLGPEPLDPAFTAAVLRASAAGRRAPVKSFLLSQERIAGVGNIYADEALWRGRAPPPPPGG